MCLILFAFLRVNLTEFLADSVQNCCIFILSALTIGSPSDVGNYLNISRKKASVKCQFSAKRIADATEILKSPRCARKNNKTKILIVSKWEAII